jgi:predicted CoA-binding protein
MVPRALIDELLQCRRLAVVGVRRNGQGFGATVVPALAKKGFEVHVVHPEAATIGGRPCVRTLAELAGKVDGVLLVTKPDVTAQLVRDAAAAGIRRVWMQQGAESPEAIRLAEELGLASVHGECILMFAEPAGFPHRVHRFFRRVSGHLPA